MDALVLLLKCVRHSLLLLHYQTAWHMEPILVADVFQQAAALHVQAADPLQARILCLQLHCSLFHLLHTMLVYDFMH